MSTQSRVKVIAQFKEFASYQEEHSKGCSSEEVPEATEVNARADGDCRSVMFFEVQIWVKIH